MKIGDKLFCIKDILFDGMAPFFKTGNIYKINSVIDNDSIVSLRAGNNLCGIYFTIYRMTGYYLLSDYFITLNEYRKLKLKKLDEVYL